MKIIVPIPFRAGEQEVSQEQVITRIREIQISKAKIDLDFEQFKLKFIRKMQAADVNT